MSITSIPPQPPPSLRNPGVRWHRLVLLMLCAFAFLVSIRGFTTGLDSTNTGALDAFFSATSNPLVALMIGVLATSILQSSSATTSLIVAMVAAPTNALPLDNAVPMVMGANIGTTVTNTLVSMGHITRRDEFRRAFAAAVLHDIFNITAVAVLFPLELLLFPLRRLSARLATPLVGISGGEVSNPLSAATNATLQPVRSALVSWFGGDTGTAALVLTAVAGMLTVASLFSLVRLLRATAASRVQLFVTRPLHASAGVSVVVGTVVTMLAQSSSVVTSLLVPLAGAGLVDIRRVLPITVGANIGTTLTALIASLAAPPATAHLAVQIALAHVLFNLVGALLTYGIPAVRRLPLSLATKLGNAAARSRRTAILYVVVSYYALPAGVIAISRAI